MQWAIQSLFELFCSHAVSYTESLGTALLWCSQLHRVSWNCSALMQWAIQSLLELLCSHAVSYTEYLGTALLSCSELHRVSWNCSALMQWAIQSLLILLCSHAVSYTESQPPFKEPLLNLLYWSKKFASSNQRKLLRDFDFKTLIALWTARWIVMVVAPAVGLPS
jgi:histone H3/H4